MRLPGPQTLAGVTIPSQGERGHQVKGCRAAPSTIGVWRGEKALDGLSPSSHGGQEP